MSQSLAAQIMDNAFMLNKDFVKDSITDRTTDESARKTIGYHNNRQFINDSISTNMNSTWYTLESIGKPIVWITGGHDLPLPTFHNYSKLADVIKRKVKAIIVLGFGPVALEVRKTFGNLAPVIITIETMKGVVMCSYLISAPGDAIVLSPGCASYAGFDNYEERGKSFIKEVRAIF